MLLCSLFLLFCSAKRCISVILSVHHRAPFYSFQNDICFFSVFHLLWNFFFFLICRNICFFFFHSFFRAHIFVYWMCMCRLSMLIKSWNTYGNWILWRCMISVLKDKPLKWAFLSNAKNLWPHKCAWNCHIKKTILTIKYMFIEPVKSHIEQKHSLWLYENTLNFAYHSVFFNKKNRLFE